jgi:signal transduction histidine kinase
MNVSTATPKLPGTIPVDPREFESAKLDVISKNLVVSALQIFLASTMLMMLLGGLFGDMGPGLTLWHWIWFASQTGLALVFLLVSSAWPAGSDAGYWGISRKVAYSALYLVSGASWGSICWVALVPGDIINQFLLMLVMICLSIIYIVRLTSESTVFLSAVAGQMTVCLPGLLSVDPALLPIIAVAAPAWLAMLANAARGLSRQFHDMIEMRLRDRELTLRLAEAYAEAEASSASKSAFLANMSHELRTPLNAILGFSDMMKESLFGPLDDRYRDYATDIHHSGAHLLSLINDLLDIAKIESGRMQVSPELLDSDETFAQIVRMTAPKAEEKSQSITLELAGAPEQIIADPRALRQMLMNIMSNAIKFTPVAGHIELGLMAEGDDAIFWVRDDGPGIAATKLSRLFRPFERVDNSYSGAASGTGLGLALVRALATLHGGTASIESNVGVGTVVTFRLPGAVHREAEIRAAA